MVVFYDGFGALPGVLLALKIEVSTLLSRFLEQIVTFRNKLKTICFYCISSDGWLQKVTFTCCMSLLLIKNVLSIFDIVFYDFVSVFELLWGTLGGPLGVEKQQKCMFFSSEKKIGKQ